MNLPENLKNHYKVNKKAIKARLSEFSKLRGEDYFYELCFCICTPQSRAAHALLVEKELRLREFLHNPFDPTALLRNPANYIRFHNQKAERLLRIREQFPVIYEMMLSTDAPAIKREWLVSELKGFGMKEASHYLRNTGHKGLAILDRHILKHLVNCNVFADIPKIGSIKAYLDAESAFLDFSYRVIIPVDELDLLFWSYEAGEIIK
jgi:N-glycosylase/DNA lyase